MEYDSYKDKCNDTTMNLLSHVVIMEESGVKKYSVKAEDRTTFFSYINHIFQIRFLMAFMASRAEYKF